MSTINPNSLASAVGNEMRNGVINPSTAIKPRKILIAGFAKNVVGLSVNTPIRVFSPEDVGAKCGFGSEIHRLAVACYKGSQSVETWISVQAEGGSDVLATATATLTIATVAKSGVLPLYISGEYVPVTISAGATVTTAAQAVVAAIVANTNLAVTASNTAGVVTLTAKTKGIFGNANSVAVGLKGESNDTGVAVAVGSFASGVGKVDISLVLAGMGVGDSSNEKDFTAVIHANGKDAVTLDALSTYNGVGLTTSGCYDRVVGRFFRSLVGSVANDLAAEITFSDGRKFDRTSGGLVVPNTPNNIHEVAATVMGVMENVNSTLANGSYFEMVIPGVIAGGVRWTDQYNNRDIAVRSGISPTMALDGAVKIQNVVTFYRPDSVPVMNNGFRSMRNIAISQNVDYVIRNYFKQESWQNITIVKDVKKVSVAAYRERARDIAGVKDALKFIASQFEGRAMIFSMDATIAGLAEADSVVIRQGGTGFDYNLKLMYSGEGGIMNSTTLFDINLSA